MGRITGPDTIKMSRATSRRSNKSHITHQFLACYQIQAPEDRDVVCLACYREGELHIFLRKIRNTCRIWPQWHWVHSHINFNSDLEIHTHTTQPILSVCGFCICEWLPKCTYDPTSTPTTLHRHLQSFQKLDSPELHSPAEMRQGTLPS